MSICLIKILDDWLCKFTNNKRRVTLGKTLSVTSLNLNSMYFLPIVLILLHYCYKYGKLFIFEFF